MKRFLVQSSDLEREKKRVKYDVSDVTKEHTVYSETDSPAALDVVQKTTSTITMSWRPPLAVLIAYNITYTENGRSAYMMTSGDVDSYELTGLVPGTLYDIDLVAVGNVGRSIAVSTSAVTG